MSAIRLAIADNWLAIAGMHFELGRNIAFRDKIDQFFGVMEPVAGLHITFLFRNAKRSRKAGGKSSTWLPPGGLAERL